jgi:AraC-like DNA-binding protein
LLSISYDFIYTLFCISNTKFYTVGSDKRFLYARFIQKFSHSKIQKFKMSIYETPLQFGYFLGLLFAVLLLLRGVQAERLSDKLLGCVLFFLAMEIQDYTFGFSGINVLWEELNGFPRHFSLVFPASVYFYLQAQINRDFRLKRQHLGHLLPYLVYFMAHIVFFVQGKAAVEAFNQSTFAWVFNQLEVLAIWACYIFYFTKSLRLYHAYRAWTETEYSDTEQIGFVWLRNFIYLIIAGEAFKWSWNIADNLLGDLPYEQDWWWHLLTVGIICYVAIKGYTQPQSKKIRYETKTHTLTYWAKAETVNDAQAKTVNDAQAETTNEATNETTEAQKTVLIDAALIAKILKIMEEDCIFLDADISLSELSAKLKTNNSLLSAAINQHFGKNFNDFINGYRVAEFQRQVALPANQHLTFLAIALDCGFNSKATFNRAYKKLTGNAPSDKQP